MTLTATLPLPALRSAVRLRPAERAAVEHACQTFSRVVVERRGDGSAVYGCPVCCGGSHRALVACI